MSEWLKIPQSLAEWEQKRPQIQEQFWGLLGALPPLFTPQVEITHRSPRKGFTIETIRFENGAGADVFGYLLIPDNLQKPAPAILYCHYHGGKHHLGKAEILLDRGSEPALGVQLVEMGYIVLGIDAYAFGERQSQGAAGIAEQGLATEISLFKQFLWEGQTLWGMMVRDDLLALNYLASHPQVDPQKIGVTGMSLGASRTTWLAALDDRLQVAIPVAQMTRYQDFAASGHFAGHGIYYYVPRVLVSGLEMELLAALVAPRHQLILIGDSDPLSPLAGIEKVRDFTQKIYQLYNAEPNFQAIIYPKVAHAYTSEMSAEMTAYFAYHLK